LNLKELSNKYPIIKEKLMALDVENLHEEIFKFNRKIF